MAARTRWFAVVGVAAVVVFIAMAAASLQRDHANGSSVVRPPAASTPTPAAASPDPAEPMLSSDGASSAVSRSVQSGPPTHLDIPAVLTAKVVPYTPKGNVLDPPDLVNAHWVTERGTPGIVSSDTVYIVGHSWRKGDAVFDAVQDITNGQEIILTVAGQQLRYRVEKTQRYLKNEAYHADEVWRIVPGRLVLISCFQRDDGRPSTENAVVYAQLTDN